MKCDGKEIVIKEEGFTTDIVNACVDKWDEYYLTCEELAASLQADTITDTCRNLFDYVLAHVNYKIDPPGKQWIRTPARLLHDKEGDCKSYSILIASCLRCLDIDCVMRFVSYRNDKEYSHVYVVAFDENCNEVKIDPVAYVQASIPFNNELKYKNKIDMRGTQISTLSGIGDTFSFTEQIENNSKLNVNYLKSVIRNIEALNFYGYEVNMQIYGMSKAGLALINEFSAQNDLQTAGYVLAKYLSENKFITDVQQDIYSLIQEIKQYTSNSVSREEYILSPDFANLSSSFLKFWSDNILAYNYVSELGISDKEKAAQLEETAPYFLYTVIDFKNLSSVAQEKKGFQESVLSEFIANSGINNATAKYIIETGILLATELPASDVLRILSGKKISGIGETADTINSITQIINGASSAFSTIYSAIQAGKNKNTTNNQNYIPSSRASSSDFFSSSNMMYWVVGGGLLALLFLFKSKKRK
jgi:hypothetical protein